MRERFFANGLSGFAEHEMLELLLAQTIRRSSTNELAHTLIDTFGDLRGVLNADYNDLLQVSGVGRETAFMLTLTGAVSREYYKLKNRERPRIRNAAEACEYCIRLLHDEPLEQLYIICLDVSLNVIKAAPFSQGNAESVAFCIREIAQTALRLGAYYVILTHNHPAGEPAASHVDIAATEQIVNALSPLGIRILDHIIVAGQNGTSLACDAFRKSTPELPSGELFLKQYATPSSVGGDKNTLSLSRLD